MLGRRAATSARVELWKTTYAGTPSAVARSRRQRLSAAYTGSPGSGSAAARADRGPELRKERRRAPYPRHPEVPPRAREADVEEGVVRHRRLGFACRAGSSRPSTCATKTASNSEPLCAVQRQQMDSAA